uniref:Sulfotransferase n=1 Tax=Gopherus agassizii TaxID=38772 RepID=A0A452GWE7_9SAUR
MADPGPRSLLYEGLLLPALVSIILPPPPGSTWMQELLTLIPSDGDSRLAQSVPSWERVPWLEQTTAAALLENSPCPQLISSHLPCCLFSTCFHGSNAKVRGGGSGVRGIERGRVLFGSWFQPFKGWLGLRDRLNFLLLTCEEMHQDLRGSVEWICQFLGKQQDAQALDGVVENTSFQAMNQNKTCNYGLGLENIMDQWVSPFLRKGVPGDWKGHFMVAQSQVFDWLYREQMQDVSIRFPWDEA